MHRNTGDIYRGYAMSYEMAFEADFHMDFCTQTQCDFFVPERECRMGKKCQNKWVCRHAHSGFQSTLLIGTFSPYITLVHFSFQDAGHTFSSRDVDLVPLENTGFWNILNVPFFTVKWVKLKFFLHFQYNFGDYWNIHGMRPIILGYFFPTITMGISTFHFRTSMIQAG